MNEETRRKIKVLPPEEARKIAAGEVIDRPAALLREFIDNAIDAGSRLIEVRIDDGGIRRTEVIDDGIGMDREDLEMCCRTHATSKIRSMEDLNRAGTLGFRGEALSAAAEVSHLEILTSADGREAWRLEVGPGGGLRPRIRQTRRIKGTSVRATDIFDAIPVRKRFLKRDWSEANQCKLTFLDKALAFPQIGFRFSQDGKPKICFPPVSTRKERFSAALLRRNEGIFLYEIGAAGDGFTITVVLGGPELSRNDRRQQYVFANGRRIQDFSLMQALEYGVQGWFPNDTHPVGAVYVDVDPAKADFNIHPAKREVRFADLGAIHHAVTQSIRDFIRHRNLAVEQQREAEVVFPNLDFEEPRIEKKYWSAGTLYRAASLAETALEGTRLSPEPDDDPQPAAEQVSPYGLKYAGRLFDLFIMVEKDNRLFIIDQHAAHERLLYDEFLSKPIPQQELLVSIPFSTESEEDDRFLETRQAELAKLGVDLESDRGFWRINALPVSWRLGDRDTVKEILNLKASGENIAEHWAATLSCHRAVKEGEALDESAALALAAAVLTLPVPRCPHGRPLWFEISKEELFKAVKRI
ncbi:MAG: DNA mismatch repair endonuclease MutL [Spirochaetaceae bacterium]|jgi:DNA mismatch repair protein MutL|nr:DNA mismatch repair endonuclease MutL [Spirochaetaceae bacterium]